MLSTTTDGKFTRNAVTVIVSGDRPWKEIAQTNPRYAGVDGRINDLEKDHAMDFVPLISDNWRNHFRWLGKGPMPSKEKEKLHSIIKKAHEQGRKVRFWATPESETLWKELKEAHVDFIGTDDLNRLRDFLIQ